MAAPKGNDYARKGLLFERALLSVIREDDGAGLIKAARALYRTAGRGEPWAIEQLANRLDGKPVARVETATDDVHSLTLQDIARLVYQARAADSSDATEVSTSTLPAESQPPGGSGDTPIEQG